MRGVKKGSKRGSYRKKPEEEKEKSRERRAVEAEAVLPAYLSRPTYSVDWHTGEIAEKVRLLSFAGLSHMDAAKILGCSVEELKGALGAFGEIGRAWSKGQEEIILLAHLAISQRIRGVKVQEIRETWEGDILAERVVVTREIPPDVDAVKYFLNHRVDQYKDLGADAPFIERLDTLLGGLEK